MGGVSDPVVRCDRCLMNFPVGEPHGRRIEYTRCSVPKCGRRFWHYPYGSSSDGHAWNAKIGIHPADYYKAPA